MNHVAPGDVDRLLSTLLDGARRSSPSVDRQSTQEQRILRAQAIISERRRRNDHFPEALFGEPGWEMLLLLYVARDRHRLTVGQLGRISGAAPTTACRWLEYLEQAELIERAEHRFDRRQAYVDLTEKARLALDQYLGRTGATCCDEECGAANQNEIP